MKMTVGTTPVSMQTIYLDSDVAPSVVRPIVQNLGPGDVFIGMSGDGITNLADEGLKLIPDALLEFPRMNKTLRFVASQADTEIRVLDLG